MSMDVRSLTAAEKIDILFKAKMILECFHDEAAEGFNSEWYYAGSEALWNAINWLDVQ